MSKLSSGASYITKASASAKRYTRPKKSPLMVIVTAFFAMVAILMSLQPVISGALSSDSSAGHTAEAKMLAISCASDMGMNMDDRADWHAALRVYPQPDATNRTWTLQEAFVKGTSFVSYQGEGGADKEWVREKPENTHKPGNYDAVAQKLEGVRSVSSCELAGTLNAVATIILAGASGVSNLVQTFVVFAFDANIICADPDNPGPACLNILKVVGGSTGESGGGIIGVLTSSVYLPLLVMAVALTGLWVAYKGLVQRKIRESLFGALWVCLSVIFGLILLLNPLLLAKAPMAVSNVVGACVIGAFNGDNCMSGNSTGNAIAPTTGGTTSNDICRSEANVAADEKMSLIVNSLSCSIWKAFILEPYAQGSFGTSFATLDTQVDGPTKKVIEKAGLNPEDFCVYLHTGESLNSFKGKAVEFDNGNNAKVCNLLAYQMSLQTQTHMAGQAPLPEDGQIDPRWYNVIVATAHDAGLWNQWSPSFTGSMHRVGISGLALVTAILGGVVLAVTAFFALVYYLSSVILMAFAPLFFLIGVHPGAGKKILLGWMEKVISSVLKYLASAVFLIVAVCFYGAILGNASNMGVTLLFVLIVTGALFMYRSELLDLIGKANMGGSQMSSALSDRIKKSAGGVASLGMGAVGAGLGAGLAGGSIASGMQDGVKRELQRGAGRKILGDTGGEILSNAARQYSRSTVDNASDLKKKATKAETEANEKQVIADDATARHKDADKELNDFDAALLSNEVKLSDLEEIRIKNTEIEDEVARDFMEENPHFAAAQQIANQIAAIDQERRVALALGDTTGAEKMDREVNSLENQRTRLLQSTVDTVGADGLNELRAKYDSEIENRKFVGNVTDYTDLMNSDEVNLRVQGERAQNYRDDLVDVVNGLAVERYAAVVDQKKSAEVATALSSLDIEREPGQNIKKAEVDAVIDKAHKTGIAATDALPKYKTYEKDDISKIIDKQRDSANRTNTEVPPETKNSDKGPEVKPETKRTHRTQDNEETTDNRRDNRRNESSDPAPVTVPIPQPTNPDPAPERQPETRRSPRPEPTPQPQSEQPRQPRPIPTQPTQPPTSTQDPTPRSTQPAPAAQPMPAAPTNPPTQSRRAEPEQPQQRPSEPTRNELPRPEPTQPTGRRAAEPQNAPRVPPEPSRAPSRAQPTPEAPAAPTRSPRIPTQPNQAPQGPSRLPSQPNTPRTNNRTEGVLPTSPDNGNSRRPGGTGIPTNRPDEN